MSNLFAQRKPTARAESPDVHPHMVVEPVGERWAVRWYSEKKPVKTYGSAVAAWDHAVRVPLHEANALPHLGLGGRFLSVHRGPKGRESWTDDPRFAQTIPVEKLSDPDRQAIEGAILAFICYRAGDGPEEEPLTIPDNPSESPPDPSGADDPWPELEALSQAERGSGEFDSYSQESRELPGMWDASDFMGGPDYNDPHNFPYSAADEAQNAELEEQIHNFLDLAQNAESEAARAYWRKAFDALG